MKTLLFALLVLLATTAWSAESAEFFFTYDHQGVPELQIKQAEIYYDAAFLCSSNTPIIDAAGNVTFECGDHDFTPGQHTFQLVLTTVNDSVGRTQVVMADIPPPPVVVPDMKDPQFIRLIIKRTGEVILTVEG